MAYRAVSMGEEPFQTKYSNVPQCYRFLNDQQIYDKFSPPFILYMTSHGEKVPEMCKMDISIRIRRILIDIGYSLKAQVNMPLIERKM